MKSTSCPIVVGRDEELELLGSQLAKAARGAGGVVVITGEAGIGKTCLGDEARRMATAAGMRVAAGRAVPGDAPAPFRPLSESVLAAFRADGLPDDEQLDAFRGHLGRLVPQWAGEASPETSTLLVGEAIVRLLRAGDGDDTGWLLVLEDLQWADADTIAVVEFLADTLVTESVLCVVSVRTDGTSGLGREAVARLRARRAQIIELAPLARDDVATMTAACLGLDAPLADLDDFIAAQSEGAPLYVEELLAGLVSSGRLIDGGDGWTVVGTLEPRATASIADSVDQRVAAIGSDGRAILSTAAVIGRRFDWQLLAEIVAIDTSSLTDTLRAAADHQLIAVDGDAFVFRHALVHQAVLDALLPPEHVLLSARALAAIERTHPDLSGNWCELAASLAESAGDLDRAATLLVKCADRCIARGALSTADQTLAHALRIAPLSNRRVVELTVIDVWPQVGKAAEAVEFGTEILDSPQIDGWSPDDRLELLNSVAQAALATGRVS
ncbi:ATP-binding protein, partial [Ilumatobacter sp.]|uniref:ATP-binding protein n=1 Tax=Ilumatobacter sp. TaxID=1967498 RepID=UPI003C525500